MIKPLQSITGHPWTPQRLSLGDSSILRSWAKLYSKWLRRTIVIENVSPLGYSGISRTSTVYFAISVPDTITQPS